VRCECERHGAPHSRTWRNFFGPRMRASVLECGASRRFVRPTMNVALPILFPTDDYRRAELPRTSKLPKGADAVTHRVVGWWRRRGAVRAALARDAEAVEAEAGKFSGLDDAALGAQLRELAGRFRRGDDGKTPELVLTALAGVREAAHRQTGLRPFRVQLMGALALDRGCLAEMATGEGKTLTAAIAAVLAGWRGRPCHVITVNDYLAERDARWFARLFAFCGVSVGHVISTMEPDARRQGYAADVTYTTSKEVVADFLRDRLRLGRVAQPGRRLIRQLCASRGGRSEDGLIMRGLYTAIVDEADSVLIDEAVTPLIICQPRANDSMREATHVAAHVAAGLARGVDYRINSRYKEIDLLEAAGPKIDAEVRQLPPMWSGLARRRELVTQALVAREFYHRDVQYVVQEGRVVIVDESTGRLMPNRTWREGLHQAVEAKEGIEVTAPTEILARLSFQKYFRLYRRLSGMTGTGRESAAEFWQIYRLPVVAIPTNRPCARVRLPDACFPDADAKWRAVVDEIVAVHAQGRPVLAGTRSVAASEELARLLGARGLHGHILNAVRHAEEAQIIEHAGEAGRITIATNMAGRGTDILLGAGVAAAGGLHVIACEPNESARVDRQLFGRAGRQGNPGSARLFVSEDDDVVRRYLPEAVRRTTARLPGAAKRDGQAASSMSHPPSTGLRGAAARASVVGAQSAAQWLAARQRASVLRHDTWLVEALSFSGPDAT